MIIEKDNGVCKGTKFKSFLIWGRWVYFINEICSGHLIIFFIIFFRVSRLRKCISKHTTLYSLEDLSTTTLQNIQFLVINSYSE